MGIFSREKYSKEGYNEAKKKYDSAHKDAQSIGTIIGIGKEDAQIIYDELWNKSAKTYERVEKLYAKGQAEATALNEEYDRLRIQAQEAIKAIADFEREKLGMHEENPDSSIEEAEEKS